jgi:outer membrane protein assembly factor BamB
VGGADWVYYTNSCGSAAYSVLIDQTRHFHLVRQWSSHISGTNPIIAGGVLYIAGGFQLSALNPSNGSVLWQGNIGSIHWEYPLVTHGHLYQTNNDGKVMAFTISK